MRITNSGSRQKLEYRCGGTLISKDTIVTGNLNFDIQY